MSQPDQALKIQQIIGAKFQRDVYKERISHQDPFDTDSPFYPISLRNLPQYRVKSFCNPDPTGVNSGDYSIFQLEIMDEELQRHYGGKFILEVWHKSGEKILSKVLKTECTKWKLYDNVLVFKQANDASFIYILWLKERKMVALKHPYEDSREEDLIYFDGHLIVAQKKNYRVIFITHSDVMSTIQAFQDREDQMAPMIEKEFASCPCNDEICALVANPLKHELIFVTQNAQKNIIFYRFLLGVTDQNKKSINLQKLVQDPQYQKKSKLSKAQRTLIAEPHPIVSWFSYIKNDNHYLGLRRGPQLFEVIENFQLTVVAESVPKLKHVSLGFDGSVFLHIEDGKILNVQNLDKINDRKEVNPEEYQKMLNFPPENTDIGQIHKNVHFFHDMVIVNQSYFVLRDKVIMIYDEATQQYVNICLAKDRVVGLYKLKLNQEDENGYKVQQFKVVAVQKNGTLMFFTPNNTIQQNQWKKTDVQQTQISNNREIVIDCFQNQNSLTNLYINTLNQAGEQKIYQVMFNNSTIDLNIKMTKNDLCFPVNFTTRNREVIGVIDNKNLSIFRNEKGNTSLMFKINIMGIELREQLLQNNSIYFFQRDYLLIITQNQIHRINTRSSQIDTLNLNETLVSSVGSCFLDTQYFYFITKDHDDNYKICVMGTDMVESAFTESSKDQINAINLDKKVQTKQVSIPYSYWNVDRQIKKLDYDEYNMCFGLLLTSLDVLSVPIVHRNTIAFHGMSERSNYLAIKKSGQNFYALDKQNTLSTWCIHSGELKNQVVIGDADYRGYEVDRGVYDKGWFSYSVIYKPVNTRHSDESLNQYNYMNYKIIEIDARGFVIEKMSFVHPIKHNCEMHLYFNADFTKMIELLINKQRKLSKPTYNLYVKPEFELEKWDWVETLDDEKYEWHTKSLYPFKLNQQTFEPIQNLFWNENDPYKTLPNNRVKILNLKDGIEMIADQNTMEVESYMALMYSFQTTRESFYDKRAGQQYIQDITERLQNYYENIRKRIFLKNKWFISNKNIDVSARSFKNKYVIEQSYTYLDFRFFKQNIQNNSSNKTLLQVLQYMSDEQIKRMVHNVFPESKTTFMHFVAQNVSGAECIEYMNKVAKKLQFVIPFLYDEQGNTPLDIVIENKDYKSTNATLKMLSRTPMDHHSRLIGHLYPKLIEMGVPSLEKYFDKRKYQTGVLKRITLGKVRMESDQEFKAYPTDLMNQDENEIQKNLFNQAYREQTIQLEVVDMPLSSHKPSDYLKRETKGFQIQQEKNDYELSMIYALANSKNEDVFGQKTVRCFIDFLWPKTRQQIIRNIFIPYLAFILYYMIYLVFLKKYIQIQSDDPNFYNYTSKIFIIMTIFFASMMFLGCFYFFSQDLYQLRNVTHNKIVLWTYANIFPLLLIILVLLLSFTVGVSTSVSNVVFSLSAFFIWIRVIHLMTCFSQTAFLLRMFIQILYKMRFLLIYIVIALVSFGYTFYFLSDDDTYDPYSGMYQMFLTLVGDYQTDLFTNIYLNVLFVIIIFFAYFFVFTLLISLAVFAYTQDCEINSNQSYQEKAAMIALYSHLLREKAVRNPSKPYLMICTVTESRFKNKTGGRSGGILSGGKGEDQTSTQGKTLKNIDRKFASLSVKFDKSLREMSERIEFISDTFKKEQANKQKKA